MHVVSLLCSVCGEIARTGAYTVPVAVLEALSAGLFDRMLVAFMDLLAAPDAVSPDACVQLLFDLYFVADVLAGPLADAAQRERFAAAEAALKANIDAFDLEVMGRYLQDSRGRAYQRLAMLLGFFTQLHPVHTDVRVKLLSSDHHSNLLALAPVAPRFSLLPVAAPQTATLPAAATRRADLPAGPFAMLDRLGPLAAAETSA